MPDPVVLRCIGRRRILVSKVEGKLLLAIRLESKGRLVYVADLVLEVGEEKKLVAVIRS